MKAMSYALGHIDWEPCLVDPIPDRALQSYARQRHGFVPPFTDYFACVPWLARALVDLHPEYGLLMHLEQATADLVVLAVSQENSCRFCYAAVRALLWAQGMSRARIERIEQDLTQAELTPETLAAIAFARRQSRAGPAAARAARQALHSAGFGIDEMKEIAFTAAITDFSNRATTIPAIPAYAFERLPDQLHMRLIRPLLGWIIKKHRYRGQSTAPQPLAPHPYAQLVQAYAGSPIAVLLGRTLTEMWDSPELTRRCKLLMLGVIARGLGCRVCGSEIGQALEAEGLSPSTIAQVLTHLDAPEIDPTERLLVAFARETIWYEPAAIQRRARALREKLEAPQFLEAIGVVALANGLCRMVAMVADDA